MQFVAAVIYVIFDLVSDCLQDSSAVSLAQLLCGLQVIAGHLHLLLLKCHHSVLQ